VATAAGWIGEMSRLSPENALRRAGSGRDAANRLERRAAGCRRRAPSRLTAADAELLDRVSTVGEGRMAPKVRAARRTPTVAPWPGRAPLRSADDTQRVRRLK
jgi:hypothetical protein